MSKKSIKNTPKSQLNEALVKAVCTNALDDAMDLIKQGANVNFYKNNGHYQQSLLITAIDNSKYTLARLLVESGADANLESYCNDRRVFCKPLQLCAAKNSHEEMDGLVRELVKRGADINVIDYYGLTPLTHAISERNEQVALTLMDLGAHLILKKSETEHYYYLAKSNRMFGVSTAFENVLLTDFANSDRNSLDDVDTQESVQSSKRMRI